MWPRVRGAFRFPSRVSAPGDQHPLPRPRRGTSAPRGWEICRPRPGPLERWRALRCVGPTVPAPSPPAQPDPPTVSRLCGLTKGRRTPQAWGPQSPCRRRDSRSCRPWVPARRRQQLGGPLREAASRRGTVLCGGGAWRRGLEVRWVGQQGRGSVGTAGVGPATTHPLPALSLLAKADLKPEIPTPPSPARAAVWQPPIGCAAPASGGRDQPVTAERPGRGAEPQGQAGWEVAWAGAGVCGLGLGPGPGRAGIRGGGGVEQRKKWGAVRRGADSERVLRGESCRDAGGRGVKSGLSGRKRAWAEVRAHTREWRGEAGTESALGPDTFPKCQAVAFCPVVLNLFFLSGAPSSPPTAPPNCSAWFSRAQVVPEFFFFQPGDSCACGCCL